MLNGCDLSDNQGVVDFGALAPGIDFAFVRASQGLSIVDMQSETNRAALRGAGKGVAHYHFAEPVESPGPEQAVIFLAAVGPYAAGEPFALDLERDFHELDHWAAEFARVIIADTGKPPLIYTNRDFRNRYGFGECVALGCGLWLATDDGQIDETVPADPWPFIAFEQYSTTGELPGVATAVDLDVFFGNIDAFHAYGADHGTLEETPTVAEPEPGAEVGSPESGGVATGSVDLGTTGEPATGPAWYNHPTF